MTVRSELNTKMAALATLLNVPVAYENNTFVPPANIGTYLEMVVMPSATIDVTVDGTRQREVGYMQINIWIKKGIGTAAEDVIFTAIKSAFPLVPKTGSVSIEATPSKKTALLDPSGYRIIPVVIPYRYETET